MLTDEPTDRGQGHPLHVIAPESKPVPVRKLGQRATQRLLQPRNAYVVALVRFRLLCGWQRPFQLALLGRHHTTRLADLVDVALRQHGAQPGGQGAPPVIIAEERPRFGRRRRAAAHSIQFGIDRVRQVATRHVLTGDGPSGSIERRSNLLDEPFPGPFVPVAAGARQRQIRETQRIQVSTDGRVVRIELGEPVRDAGRQGLDERRLWSCVASSPDAAKARR